MKITQALYLTFTASPQTSVYINIPFTVSKIHVKSMNYQAGTNGTTRNVVVESSLGLKNDPFGIINQDQTYSSPAFQDVELKFQNPQFIQGFFTFTLRQMSGALAATSNGGAATDYLGIIVEFNSEEELN
jgi:hypothetical protein